jgi:hypothetical protein
MSGRVECPTCGRLKPDFAIRAGRCKEDEWDEQHLGETRAAQSWERRKTENARNQRPA